MTIAAKIEQMMTKSSWIRKMFEEGAMLKAKHGAENVFDFSLGNPNLPPPSEFRQKLIDAAKDSNPQNHSYMPNVGYPHVRKNVAAFVSIEQKTTVSEENIIMTCGAAGALNVVFKSLLNPGEEVIVPAPYFVEYNFYTDNHGGVLVPVITNEDFTLNLDVIEKAINQKTKIILINSPNNPTGQIYSEESLNALGKLLEAKSAEFGTTIYLLSDEPYRKIVYDGATVPGIFQSYKETIVATSYSKDISIPGERIGFLAVNPRATYAGKLMEGMTLANRILGYVNAPAMMQRVISDLQGTAVDMSLYEANRTLFYDALTSFGYSITKPTGAFYLFPKSPIPDDVAFVKALQEELILTVPGVGFGGPGHFRIAYCVETTTIEKSLPGFEKVMKKYKL